MNKISFKSMTVQPLGSSEQKFFPHCKCIGIYNATYHSEAMAIYDIDGSQPKIFDNGFKVIELSNKTGEVIGSSSGREDVEITTNTNLTIDKIMGNSPDRRGGKSAMNYSTKLIVEPGAQLDIGNIENQGVTIFLEKGDRPSRVTIKHAKAPFEVVSQYCNSSGNKPLQINGGKNIDLTG